MAFHAPFHPPFLNASTYASVSSPLKCPAHDHTVSSFAPRASPLVRGCARRRRGRHQKPRRVATNRFGCIPADGDFPRDERLEHLLRRRAGEVDDAHVMVFERIATRQDALGRGVRPPKNATTGFEPAAPAFEAASVGSARSAGATPPWCATPKNTTPARLSAHQAAQRARVPDAAAYRVAASGSNSGSRNLGSWCGAVDNATSGNHTIHASIARSFRAARSLRSFLANDESFQSFLANDESFQSFLANDEASPRTRSLSRARLGRGRRKPHTPIEPRARARGTRRTSWARTAPARSPPRA